MISHAGEVRVLDFGIAKAAASNEQTRAGALRGKFAYMSPEQIRAEGSRAAACPARDLPLPRDCR
jgi:serine/threonine-protein kinase